MRNREHVMTNGQLRVAMIGHKRIPSREGGVEIVVEELSTCLLYTSQRVTKAGPSEPVEVIGFNDVPNAGDIINAVDDDKLSRQVAEERKDKLRAALVKKTSTSTLDELFSQISQGEVKDLNLIIKADVQGSVQAVRQSLEKLTNEEVRVRTIHAAAGNITESDVLLASVSNAIIIGFNVKMDANVGAIAERDKVCLLYTSRCV